MQGYHKIESSTSGWQFTKKEEKQFQKTPFCVTEKVHGASLCFHLTWDPQHEHVLVLPGKRRGALAPDEYFFNYQSIVGEMQQKMIPWFQKQQGNTDVIIYGELFGGAYPTAKEYQQWKKKGTDFDYQKAVQSGIWYDKDLHFYAFDMAMEKEGQLVFLHYEDAMNHFEEMGLLYAKPLFIGTYQACQAFPIDFESTIPKLLGNPPLVDNLAEGVVIKSLREIPFGEENHRAIVKKKIERFSEQCYNTTKKSYKEGQLSNATLIGYELESYVTKNRLANVMSKLGTFPLEDVDGVKAHAQLLLKELQEDVMEDFESLDKHNFEQYQSLLPTQKTTLASTIKTLAQQLIHQEYKRARRCHRASRKT